MEATKPILVTLLAAAALLLTPGRAAEPDPKAVAVTVPDKIEWRKGASSDTANLQGDPSKPGLYIQLIKWHPHNMSRPHFHSTERYITVLSGTWWIGTGTKYDPDSTYPVNAGTYVVDLAKQIHYDGAKDTECVLEIVGMGPVTTTQAETK
ncbi:MAG TPA: cupin domain-containing protein [Bryobacteraceae bacterium]|jgi:hypothetical protein